MKKIFKKTIWILVSLVVAGGVFLFVADKFIMPNYVESPEVKLPDLVGKHKQEALNILEQLGLNPVIKGTRYDDSFPKDHVMFQNPSGNTNVKIGRNVYLFISGGEPLVKMPDITGKTLRDAKITIERLGLNISAVEKIRSEYPADIVVEQEFPEGTNLSKGDSITIKISVGPKVGMIRVPNLLGKPLKRGKRILRNNSLRLGKINYQLSPNLLPNTIVDQYPSENKLVAIGDSVDVIVTRN